MPFTFGTLTVHMQVHILDNPPYACLIGRPLDVLTESIVQTSRDGYQKLILTDPNSGKRIEVGTYERGKGIVSQPTTMGRLVSENPGSAGQPVQPPVPPLPPEKVAEENSTQISPEKRNFQ